MKRHFHGIKSQKNIPRRVNSMCKGTKKHDRFGTAPCRSIWGEHVDAEGAASVKALGQKQAWVFKDHKRKPCRWDPVDRGEKDSR